MKKISTILTASLLAISISAIAITTAAAANTNKNSVVVQNTSEVSEHAEITNNITYRGYSYNEDSTDNCTEISAYYLDTLSSIFKSKSKKLYSYYSEPVTVSFYIKTPFPVVCGNWTARYDDNMSISDSSIDSNGNLLCSPVIDSKGGATYTNDDYSITGDFSDKENCYDFTNDNIYSNCLFSVNFDMSYYLGESCHESLNFELENLYGEKENADGTKEIVPLVINREILPEYADSINTDSKINLFYGPWPTEPTSTAATTTVPDPTVNDVVTTPTVPTSSTSIASSKYQATADNNIQPLTTEYGDYTFDYKKYDYKYDFSNLLEGVHTVNVSDSLSNDNWSYTFDLIDDCPMTVYFNSETKEIAIKAEYYLEIAPGDSFGDLDGDKAITISDATYLQRFLSDESRVNVIFFCADINKDGEIDINDVTALQRMLVEI